MFGFPGTIFILFSIAIFTFPSASQKQQIIDYYVLLKWTGDYRLIILPIFIMVCGFIGQNRIYRYKYSKKLEIKEKEIERISNEKTKLQEKLSKRDLHHSGNGKEGVK